MLLPLWIPHTIVPHCQYVWRLIYPGCSAVRFLIIKNNSFPKGVPSQAGPYNFRFFQRQVLKSPGRDKRTWKRKGYIYQLEFFEPLLLMQSQIWNEFLYLIMSYNVILILIVNNDVMLYHNLSYFCTHYVIVIFFKDCG